MYVVRTVTGDLPAAELGVTLPHEHLLTTPPKHVTDPDFTMDSVEAAVGELEHYRRAGGQALVEMSTVDYGRQAEGLQELARTTGVHIVCATGFIKEAFFGDRVSSVSESDLSERMIRDVSQGIDNTTVKAGVIKAGSSKNKITTLERKVFSAAIAAHHASGTAISTHTEAGTMALEQVELLTAGGVPPDKILIGHVDRKLDLPYHLEIAATGVTLGFDQFSKEKYHPDHVRISVIADLVAAGHANQIVLSGDLARRSYWPSYGGGPGLTYIPWRVAPWLREVGLTQDTVQQMLVATPARLLGMEGKA